VEENGKKVVWENALGGRGGTKRPFRVEGDHPVYGPRRVVAQVATLERAQERMAADTQHTNKRILDLRTYPYTVVG